MSTAQISIERRDRVTHGEYLAHVEGHDAAARLSWTQRGMVRDAEHTLVPQELRGRGIAAELVTALVDDAQAQSFKVRPSCSYVAAWFDRHPEWKGLRA